jgi:hypothetical protein
MKLTQANYYGKKANLEYFSVSQFKDFMKCPAMAVAKLRGEYEQEPSRALLLGSYVDEMLTGTRESQMKFLEENHSELFKKNGDYYADVAQAADTIERIKNNYSLLWTPNNKPQGYDNPLIKEAYDRWMAENGYIPGVK